MQKHPNVKIMKLRKKSILITIIIIVSTSFKCYTSNNFTYFFQQHSQTSSDKLLYLGKQYSLRNQLDSAFVCYNIVANRYSSKSSKQEKILSIDAYLLQWQIYFYHFFDYKMSLDMLHSAKTISEDIGQHNPKIPLFYGSTYNTLSNQTGKKEYKQLALRYFKQALKLAIKQNDTAVSDEAFGNIVITASDSVKMEDITNEWLLYESFNSDHDNNYRKYTELLYSGYLNYYNGNYDMALDCFEKQSGLVNDICYLSSVYWNMSMVYERTGNHQKAIECLNKAEFMAEKDDIKDILLEIYIKKAKYYQKLGDLPLANEYYTKSNTLNKELLSYKQLAGVNEANFMHSLNKAEEDIKKVKKHNKFLTTTGIAMTAFCLIVLSFLIVIYKKNKQLHQSNQRLYKKNVELLEYEKSERELRQKYELLIAKKDCPATKKDKTTGLTDERKEDIRQKIISILENNEEIYSSDFSANKLASLIEVNYVYISQIINEKFACNFNQLINSYRIKEACRRITDDPQYSNLTIEAIASNVGFKSRTTFIASFKQMTGLTPSQYIRIARETNR